MTTEELDPVEMRQFLRIIFDQASSMRNMIGDLLDVARIETGNLAISLESTEVLPVLDRARNNFLSAEGRTMLVFDLAPDLPAVMADRRRIVQVMGNLLTNAARHSPESSVITVSAEREGGHVLISVVDEGRGIPRERLPHLFRKFSRRAVDDPKDDIGLGLAICKGIVEAHGGRIWAESDGAGLGARFSFTLPVAEEAPDGPSSRSTGPSIKERRESPFWLWTTIHRRSAPSGRYCPKLATTRWKPLSQRRRCPW